MLEWPEREVVAMSEGAPRASQIIDEQLASLANVVVERQYALQPGLWEGYGEEGREKSVRDAGYHLTYLSQALSVSDPSLFANYVAWTKVLFAGLGFPDGVLVATLKCTREVLNQHLPPDLSAITDAYVATALETLSETSSSLSTYLEPDAPLADLAQDYLRLLLQGERHMASSLILDAVGAGARVKDIYLHVFQPTQREIGRLWQMNWLTVAQEHYCTAATQLIMSQLYPHVFATERIGHRAVVTCVGGELHEIGARMVADFFEMEGWDAYYLGANTPADSILRTLEEREAEVLAVSATMTFHVSAVADLIAQVRAGEAGRAVKTLVGGYPFNLSPGLWETVGAHGCAPDAQEAVVLAMRMVGEE
jgi:methanogenic corrinoid protein MtbC1